MTLPTRHKALLALMALCRWFGGPFENGRLEKTNEEETKKRKRNGKVRGKGREKKYLKVFSKTKISHLVVVWVTVINAI